MSKLKIGCHLSSSDGYLAMGKKIISMGGNTFQFFTRNPRGGQAKPLDIKDIEAFNSFARENGISYIVAHAPYTLNLCSADSSIRNFAFRTFEDDLMRLNYVDKVYYNFHPGSHVGQGYDVGINFIVEALNKLIKKEQRTMILLETMAGKGSEVGCSFEQLRTIIDGVEEKDRIGVCLDTCHISDGGYDIVSNLDGVLEEFDRIIGLDRLKAIHLNDSMNERGARKDRHQKIGKGYLGSETIINIINHPLLKDLPFILETPNEDQGYIEEIAYLNSNYR